MVTERDEKGRFKGTSVMKKEDGVSKKRVPQDFNSTPAGSTGLKRNQGYVQEEYLSELTGNRGAKIFQEMRDNDPIVGAMFFGIEMFLRRVKWHVDSVEDSKEGEEKAKFLRECMVDMSHTWPDLIAEIMSMMEHGWSWFEIVYKRRTGDSVEDGTSKSLYDDGKIGWRKIEIRSQESLDNWEFDEEGGIKGLWQMPAPEFTRRYIPIEKSLLFRTTSRKNNPQGRSVLRNAYRPYYFKKRFEEIEGVGVERDLAGLPFAEVPAEMMREDASDSDKETLKSIVQMVKNVRRDEQEGVVWPQQWSESGQPMYNFKLLSSGGARQFNTSEIIARYDSRIAMVVLADFILLGTDSGSNASIGATTTKSGLFQSALSVWLDGIQDVLNTYAVPRLFKLNGDNSGKYPKFRHEEVQKPSLADLATFVSALTGAGAQLFPDVELENHFRKLALLPDREVKESDTAREDDLREKTQDAQIAVAEESIKNPGGAKVQPLGKNPNSVPGAPTKTTGKVKSKLPPASRRNTKSVLAEQNVAKAAKE